MKGQDWQMWYKIYKESTGLYDKLQRFHRKFPISPGEIQFWTAEMCRYYGTNGFGEKKRNLRMN